MKNNQVDLHNILMERKRACPFCGKQDAAIDTLNYANGNPAKFRFQCQGCLAATRWCDTAGQAESAWGRRAETTGAGSNQLGTGLITIKEMASKLGINVNTTMQRLFKAKIKPLFATATYPESALEAIRDVLKPGQNKKWAAGRPKRAAAKGAKPRGARA